MVWDILLSAVALLFIVEGLLPAISPDWCRKTMLKLVAAEDHVLRSMGLGSLVVGAVIMFLVHSGMI